MPPSNNLQTLINAECKHAIAQNKSQVSNNLPEGGAQYPQWLYDPQM